MIVCGGRTISWKIREVGNCVSVGNGEDQDGLVQQGVNNVKTPTRERQLMRGRKCEFQTADVQCKKCRKQVSGRLMQETEMSKDGDEMGEDKGG